MKKILAFIALLGTIAVIAYGQNQKASETGVATGTVIPAGTVMPFAGSSAPSGWVLSYGQELSQTTYAKLYAVLGATYCTADHGGGCTGGFFRVPDLRGRVLAGKDNMGGTAASRLTSAGSIDGTVLGKAGGTQNHSIGSANLPTHTHAAGTLAVSIDHNHTATATDGTHTHVMPNVGTQNSSASYGTSAFVSANSNFASADMIGNATSTGSSHSHGISNYDVADRAVTNSTADGGFANNAIQNLQPTSVINYIIKI